MISTIELTSVPILKPSPDCKTWKPQPLTHEEREYLFSFNNSLPELFRSIQPDNEPGEHEREFCDEDCLTRYLRAAKWKLEDAQKKLIATLQWRKDYQPDKITADEVEPESVTGKNYVNGFDKFNRPTIYLKPGKENTKTYSRQIKFLVYNLETVTRHLGPWAAPKVVLVIDFEGWTPRTAPSLGTSKEILSILSDHYPERLAAAYLVNAPWLFFGFFKILTPFIDPATRHKVRFVDLQKQSKVSYDPNACDLQEEEECADAKVDIRSYFLPAYLEDTYGGSFPFRYEHEIYWKHLTDVRNPKSTDGASERTDCM